MVDSIYFVFNVRLFGVHCTKIIVYSGGGYTQEMEILNKLLFVMVRWDKKKHRRNAGVES